MIAAAVGAFAITSGDDDPSTSTSATPFVGGDLHSLVGDPTDPSRLYVGGHEGVAESTDGGKTWSQVDDLAGADAMGWAFLGSSNWVGGHPGLSVSTDGGGNFGQRNDGLPSTDIHALGGTGHLLYAASPEVGVLASEDGGETWEVRSGSVGRAFMGHILVDNENPSHIVAPDMQAGAVESHDGGRTWRVLGGVSGGIWASWDAADTKHIIVSAIGAAAETSDGGKTWTPLNIPPGASVVEFVREDRDRLYAAVLSGSEASVFASEDGGDSWVRP